MVFAISAALQVLGFLELPEDDVPAEELWQSEEHLKNWFDAVKRRHRDGVTDWQPVADDDPDMTGNEIAKQYREG